MASALGFNTCANDTQLVNVIAKVRQSPCRTTGEVLCGAATCDQQCHQPSGVTPHTMPQYTPYIMEGDSQGYGTNPMASPQQQCSLYAPNHQNQVYGTEGSYSRDMERGGYNNFYSDQGYYPMSTQQVKQPNYFTPYQNMLLQQQQQQQQQESVPDYPSPQEPQKYSSEYDSRCYHGDSRSYGQSQSNSRYCGGEGIGNASMRGPYNNNGMQFSPAPPPLPQQWPGGQLQPYPMTSTTAGGGAGGGVPQARYSSPQTHSNQHSTPHLVPSPYPSGTDSGFSWNSLNAQTPKRTVSAAEAPPYGVGFSVHRDPHCRHADDLPRPHSVPPFYGYYNSDRNSVGGGSGGGGSHNQSQQTMVSVHPTTDYAEKRGYDQYHGSNQWSHNYGAPSGGSGYPPPHHAHSPHDPPVTVPAEGGIAPHTTARNNNVTSYASQPPAPSHISIQTQTPGNYTSSRVSNTSAVEGATFHHYHHLQRDFQRPISYGRSDGRGNGWSRAPLPVATHSGRWHGGFVGGSQGYHKHHRHNHYYQRQQDQRHIRAHVSLSRSTPPTEEISDNVTPNQSLNNTFDASRKTNGVRKRDMEDLEGEQR